MPQTSSAKKALRVSRTNTIRNRRQRDAMKKAVKASTPTLASATVSRVNKAAKRGIISKARAARLTSQIMRSAKTAQLSKRSIPGLVAPKITKPVRKPATKRPVTNKGLSPNGLLDQKLDLVRAKTVGDAKAYQV